MQGAAQVAPTASPRPRAVLAQERSRAHTKGSDWLDAPCPTKSDLGTAANPSITLFQAKDRKPYPGSPFTAGGVNLPWGITVDGDDTVWVFNFGTVPPGTGMSTELPTGISRFCGIDTKKCPPGMKVGDPISPDTGYRTNALQRTTAGAVDPSGNLWLTNNWKIDANPEMNPGANAVRRLAQGNRLGAQITQHPSSVMSGPRLRFLLWHSRRLPLDRS